MTHGLVVGKFAPLHKGHQVLLDRAYKEMDRLTVLVYDAEEVTDVPLDVRAEWVRDLYPQARVVEGWCGPTEVGDTPEIRKTHEDYVIKTLGITGITHFYSSEFYGDHMSKALGAVNIVVDEARVQVPISGTAVRKDYFRNREFIHPRVYRDLITSVVFVGAESSGKSTLAEAMAKELNTVWVPEYGREYWLEHQCDHRLILAQLSEIAIGHEEREDALWAQANEYLFVDTGAVTTAVFSRYYHGEVPDIVEARLARNSITRYDLHVLCDIDIPYEDTWDREGSEQRKVFQKMIEKDLVRRRIPFVRLSGTLEERVRKLKLILWKFNKHKPIMETLRGFINA